VINKTSQSSLAMHFTYGQTHNY